MIEYIEPKDSNGNLLPVKKIGKNIFQITQARDLAMIHYWIDDTWDHPKAMRRIWAMGGTNIEEGENFVRSTLLAGFAFLSEGLAEYSAVSLLAKEKGEKQLRKFLKYELDKYLGGRSMEKKFESPIVQTEGQAYIHYNKAGLMMYALSDFIGKEIFNNALDRFIDKFRYQSEPYTNIGEFVKTIREDMPDDL